MNIAVIGTQGVPAHYGGFESLVENLITFQADHSLSYTVYCSRKDLGTTLASFKGARLKYWNLRANGISSILYDMISICDALKYADTLLILGVSGCTILPFIHPFHKKRIIVNIDGREYKRKKWGPLARFILKISERAAVCYSDLVIADNKAIQDYVRSYYKHEARCIAYGGDHVLSQLVTSETDKILSKYGLQKNNYALALCRIEPENNCDTIINAFKDTDQQLVFVGNWNYSDYGKRLLEMSTAYPNILLLDSIYDLQVRSVLQLNAKYYIHGHSAGGTNPSLVEAMFYARPIICYDVIYNRETTQNQALYFNSSTALHEIITSTIDFDPISIRMRQIAEENYRWEQIVKTYEASFHE